MEDWWQYMKTRTEPKITDMLVTKCLICGEDMPVYSIHDAPKICVYCKNAVIWAREKMKQGEK
jgi:hypothetical protein